MRASSLTCILSSLAMASLAACQQPPPASSAPASPAQAAPPVIPAPATAPGAAGTAALPADQARARNYRIDITVPKLGPAEQPLAAALRRTADSAKREFLRALPDPAQSPEFADRQLSLILAFKVVATTPAFISVREEGGSDTGGAHPIPVQATFVYDRRAHRLLTLDDLFTDPDAARRALAGFAHDALMKKLMAGAPTPSEASPEALRDWRANTVQMLEDGTRPTSVNFSLFVVRPGADARAASPGLTLVFPPYQVAPYVDGTQLVDVPATLFAQYLKPGYASDFATR